MSTTDNITQNRTQNKQKKVKRPNREVFEVPNRYLKRRATLAHRPFGYPQSKGGRAKRVLIPLE